MSLPTGNVLKVMQYLLPTTLAFGTIGNVLSIVAVTNRHCKKSMFTTYIAALGVADLGSLYLFVLPVTLLLFDINIFEIPSACKFVSFLLNLTTQMSSWIIAAMTLERAFSVFFPLKVKSICRPRNGCIVIAIIFVFFLALNSHILYGFQSATVNNFSICGFVDQSYEEFSVYFNWINGIVIFLIPVVVIIVANSATVMKVMTMGNLASATVPDNRRKRNRYLLIMTLLVSITYIVLVTPWTVYYSLRPYLYEEVDPYFFSNDTDELLGTIVYQLAFVNYGVNFYLYVLSGQRFRQDLKAAFPCCGVN